MRELDRIIEEGNARIDAAIQAVCYKWDHTPYGNGINDDTEVLQRLLDRHPSGLKLAVGVHVVSRTLNA